MPKLAQMKALLERAKAYKEQFTPGFYHGSPSPNIKVFDASKGDRSFPTEGVTFVTRNPSFAEGFLDMHRNKAGGWDYDKGATIYPVSVNLGKHFVPGSKEGMELIDQYVAKLPNNPDAALSAAKRAAALKAGSWDVMEDPRFLEYLKNTGHDTFTVVEGGVPNVGVFEPHNIRGKFAQYNPDEAMNPDFMKAEGGLVHLAKGGDPDAPWNQKVVPNPEDLMGTFSYAPGYYGEVADRINPEGQSAGVNDALRHMLAAGDIARRVSTPIRASGLSSITPGGIPLVSENVGPAVARGLGIGHEIMNYIQNIGGEKPQTNEDLAQDLHNNAVGAELGKTATSFQDLIDKMPAAINVRPYQKEKGKALIRHPDEVGTPYKPFKWF